MSNQNFLYQEYNILSPRIDKTIPNFVLENLSPKFELRPYQIEAFTKFFDYLKLKKDSQRLDGQIEFLEDKETSLY